MHLEDKLKKTIENFSRHLKEGGVLIIEPWISRRAYKIGSPHMDTYSNDKIKISRMHVSKKKGNLSVIDFHFTIAEKNKGVQHFIDRHEIGMFEHKEILSIMKYLGIKTKFLKTGRGLFIGIKK